MFHAATATIDSAAGVVIREITPADLDGQITAGPMPYAQAQTKIGELNETAAQHTLYVIAAE